MRGVIFLLSLAAMCGGAQASSFVVLGDAPVPAPSIVTLGGAEPSAPASPSIVALGEPDAGVSYDKVAAIPKPREPRLSPMVIRGGIVGGQSTFAPVRPEPAAAKPALPGRSAAAKETAPPAPPADEETTSTPAAPRKVPL